MFPVNKAQKEGVEVPDGFVLLMPPPEAGCINLQLHVVGHVE